MLHGDMVNIYGAEPSYFEMERRTLEKKGIGGPTNAHVIEELHTPLNLAFVTFTTGSSGFQKPVGVTYEELPARTEAGRAALRLAGIKAGSRILVTYPPLINVFTKQAFDELCITVDFLYRSNRDACLKALLEYPYQAVIGESGFLRSTMEMISLLGWNAASLKGLVLLCAGTPLDIGILEIAADFNCVVHDLYGCQEFGCISLDGLTMRKDVCFIEWAGEYHIFVGGLAVGDYFPVCKKGHGLNKKGNLLSYDIKRSTVEWETILFGIPAGHRSTAERTAHTILRLKGKVVRVSNKLLTNTSKSLLKVRPVIGERTETALDYPGTTHMFDHMVRAQMDYQRNGKADPIWRKW